MTYSNTHPLDSQDTSDTPCTEGGRIPLSVVIVSDDQATVQTLVSACELVFAYACRVRVAALNGDPSLLRTRSGEVLILDTANARDRRVDPARHPASPTICVAHGLSEEEKAMAAQAHANVLFSNLCPATLELAIRTAQQNWRLLATQRRSNQAAQRSAQLAREAQRRMLEEVGPIAHGLEGLLDIIGSEQAQTGGPTQTQLDLLRNWTRDLVLAVGRHQDAMAVPGDGDADMTMIVDDAVALFRSRCDALGHTVVLSSPHEPIVVAADPRRLRNAVTQLMEGLFEREAQGRRIDIVHWRSMQDCRLAIVTGPPVRRSQDAMVETAPVARPAGPADARFMAALAQMRELGAVVETCASACGTSLLVTLPVA